MKTSVIDILFRVDEICRKYEKYDVDIRQSDSASTGDAFADLYASVESDIDAALKKSEMVATETNRAAAAAMKAEVRRTKAKLLGEVPRLLKLANKKVKGLSKEEEGARKDLVMILSERIQSIPDGSSSSSSSSQPWPSSRTKINFTSEGDKDFNTAAFFEQTEESKQLRQEYEMRKLKQDEGLEEISEGLHVLKNLAKDMNEELDRQVPLIDEIDSKADKATSDIRRSNARLKETITKMRSSQNFCMDFTLMCILLGIVLYLYNLLR